MGSKAQEVGLELFYYSMQLCDCNWMKCLNDSSTVLCLQFVLIYASYNLLNFINKKITKNSRQLVH